MSAGSEFRIAYKVKNKLERNCLNSALRQKHLRNSQQLTNTKRLILCLENQFIFLSQLIIFSSNSRKSYSIDRSLDSLFQFCSVTYTLTTAKLCLSQRNKIFQFPDVFIPQCIIYTYFRTRIERFIAPN